MSQWVSQWVSQSVRRCWGISQLGSWRTAPNSAWVLVRSFLLLWSYEDDAAWVDVSANLGDESRLAGRGDGVGGCVNVPCTCVLKMMLRYGTLSRFAHLHERSWIHVLICAVMCLCMRVVCTCVYSLLWLTSYVATKARFVPLPIGLPHHCDGLHRGNLRAASEAESLSLDLVGLSRQYSQAVA